MRIQDHLGYLTATNANVETDHMSEAEFQNFAAKKARSERLAAKVEKQIGSIYTARDLAREIDAVMSTEASNAVMLREIGKLVRLALGGGNG